ncbi:histidine phosphatase family protein [Hyphomicrobium sp.]|jgi:phosphohistidine phosphatase|uniref:SixA phosphatase family protein n=1 Tax=Hyphomicrobium sp. TaxID=82 RepID=UPI002B50F0AC|nr:histidine phosphatase family protein [Hyphomicrobium sp.]HVZ03731.1 histidine phosphatase family protein [Hyphomicrobium sp.]
MLALALLRHAKSSWESGELDDFDRPLNARGRSAAPLMGEALRSIKFEPQLILCSPAKRTRETLELLEADGADTHAQIIFDEQLYLTNPETLLDRLRQVAPTSKRVLMIGHNPGLHGLALMLTETGDAKSISRIEDKFPTCALAVFSFRETAWRDVGSASGHLEVFMTPRDRASAV